MKKKLWPLLLLTGLMAACQADHAGEMSYEKTANREPMISRSDTGINEDEHAGQKQTQMTEGLNQKQLTAKIQKIVREAGDFTIDSVMINGVDLWVIVHTNRPLSPREIIKENAALTKKLNKAFPRFRANVKVEQSWQVPGNAFS